MSISIFMPALSPTMTSGHLLKWHKNVGDRVQPGEVLLEIETDKAVMEMEAADEGMLAHIVVLGGTESVPVGQVLAILREENDTEEALQTLLNQILSSMNAPGMVDPVSPPPTDFSTMEKTEFVTPSPVVQSQAPDSTHIKASPLAKKLAQIQGISLEEVLGSGPRGRIVKRDIEEAVQRQEEKVSPPDETSHRTHRFDFETLAEERLPITAMRRTIARRLTESKSSIPHFYLGVECYMDALISLRQSLNDQLKFKALSVNDFLVRACALALHQVPELNRIWADTHMVQYNQVDLAVAVSVEGGLITPLLRNAAQKPFRQMADELKELIGKARTHQLRPEDYQGGSFTLSNLGMFGVEEVQAIINPPHAGILAVGASVEKPIVRKGALAMGLVMKAVLSADHRVVDGGAGAKFLAQFKAYVEAPMLLLYV